MPTSELVLCDTNNKRLIVLDPTLTIKHYSDLPEKPHYIALWNETDVIVTMQWAKKLQFVQVLPNFKLGRSFKMHRVCGGIAVFKNNIFVSFHDNPGDGELRVYDKDIQLKQVILGAHCSAYQPQQPDYLNVSEASDLYISDEARGCVFRRQKMDRK